MLKPKEVLARGDNSQRNFPHGLEAELIDSIQSNKPPFLLVLTF